MSDWLIGLSQGLTNGILFKQRQEEDQFRKTQDILVEQIHRDAANIRPEDRMKLLEPVHAITTAKNQKQLDAAWGRYAAMGVAENYEQERADREYNANLPTETQAPPMMMEGMGVASLPAVPGKSPAISLPAGPPVQVEGQSDPIPVAERQFMMRDPNAYAQGKVRYSTDEGKMSRQIEVYESQQRSQLTRQQALERSKADSRIRQWEETHANEISGRSTITYDPERNVTTQTARTKDGRTITQEVPGMPTNYATAQARIKSTEGIQAENRKQRDKLQAEKLKFEREKFAVESRQDEERISISRQRLSQTRSANSAGSVAFRLADKQWNAEKESLLIEMRRYLADAERKQGDFEDDADYEKATKESLDKYTATKNLYETKRKEYLETLKAIETATPEEPKKEGSKANTSSKPAPRTPITVQGAVDKYFKSPAK